MFRVVGKRALFRGKGALFGVVHTKLLGHYFEVALFEVALFEVLLYDEKSHIRTSHSKYKSLQEEKEYQ